MALFYCYSFLLVTLLEQVRLKKNIYIINIYLLFIF